LLLADVSRPVQVKRTLAATGFAALMALAFFRRFMVIQFGFALSLVCYLVLVPDAETTPFGAGQHTSLLSPTRVATSFVQIVFPPARGTWPLFFWFFSLPLPLSFTSPCCCCLIFSKFFCDQDVDPYPVSSFSRTSFEAQSSPPFSDAEFLREAFSVGSVPPSSLPLCRQRTRPTSFEITGRASFLLHSLPPTSWFLRA